MKGLVDLQGPAAKTATTKQPPIDDAGLRLRRQREKLNLRYRDVEDASLKIAAKHKNDEFAIALSRLSDIENKGTVPSIYRLYSLCAIYRLNLNEVLEWYHIPLASLGADASLTPLAETHTIDFQPVASAAVSLPISLDPGIDLRRTTFLSRMIQRWGAVPLMLLAGEPLADYRYGVIGTDDWSMYPIIAPGSLVLIDDNVNRIVNSGWASELERPIYFLEHHGGYCCGWCTVSEEQVIVQPHPSSQVLPRVFPEATIDVIGQVLGVAMRFDPERRRGTRSA